MAKCVCVHVPKLCTCMHAVTVAEKIKYEDKEHQKK